MMPNPSRVTVCAIALAGIGAVTAASVAFGAPAAAIAQLAGRWSGPGIVTPSKGPNENFKCVVTYFAEGQGARMRQNLRCRNSNYSLDASTHLAFSGNKVTGHWRENTHSLDGTVSGVITPDGFDIYLSGRFFQARMHVAGTGCMQSVRVSPAKTDQFRQITADLKRC